MPAEKNHPVFREPDDPNIRIWRYMDFTKFVSLLDHKALYFTRADLFEDEFEGAMSRANFKSRLSAYLGFPATGKFLKGIFTPEYFKELSEFREQIRKQIFINCWHMNERESAAMWKLYTRSNEAIAIQSTFQLLHLCLPANTYIGVVQYIDYEDELLPENHVLQPLMHKRKSFEHERELRCVIHASPDNPEKNVGNPIGDAGRIVSISLSDLIQKVYVAPTSPDWFAHLVVSVMSKYELNTPVVKSSLDEKPIF